MYHRALSSFSTLTHTLKWLALLGALPLSACDVVGDMVYDCLDNDGPEIQMESDIFVTVDEYFNYSFVSQIKREPRDDTYNYNYSLEGDLPPGIRFYHSPNAQSASLTGVPDEVGTYHFEIEVEVAPKSEYVNEQDDEYYEDGDDLCSISTSKGVTVYVSPASD